MRHVAFQISEALEIAGQSGDIAPDALAPVARRRWAEAFDQGPTQPEHLELLQDHSGGAADQDGAKDEDNGEGHAAAFDDFGGKSVAESAAFCRRARSRMAG